jgi:hypothetical protein
MSPDSWTGFGIFMPFLASFPLFVLSLGISRLAVFGLWIAAVWNWIAIVLISAHDAGPGLGGFLDLLAVSLFRRTVFLLFLLASLALFGVRIFGDFMFDRFLIRKFGAGRAAAN